MEIVLNKINKISFDAFSVKMIAIIAMVIDHVGDLFFPKIFIFRIIGRLTLPIMAYFITEGYRKTRNVKRYMFRLTIAAVISMIPYHLVFEHSYFNILFDLLFGLLNIYITDKLEKDWQKWTVVIFFFLIALILNTDGMFGASVLVYLFHRYRDNFKKMVISMTILYTLQLIMITLICVMTNNLMTLYNYTIWIRPFALCALFFIHKYNGERGKSIKYLFYIFYPGHLMILYFIKLAVH